MLVHVPDFVCVCVWGGGGGGGYGVRLLSIFKNVTRYVLDKRSQ